MNPVRLAHAHLVRQGLLEPAAEPVGDAACWLCGLPTEGRGFPKKGIITSAFTAGTDARAPTSESLCED